MVTPSTGLPLELDDRTPRLRDLVYGLFQSFRRASRVRASNTLNGVAQQVGDVVLVHLSPSQLFRKSAPQVVPGQSAFNLLTKWNSCLLAGLRETTSESARAYSCEAVIEYASACSIQNDFA